VPWWAQGGAKPPPGLQQKVLQDAMAKTTAGSDDIERLTRSKSKLSSKDGTLASASPPSNGANKSSRSLGSSEAHPVGHSLSAAPSQGQRSSHAAVSKPPLVHGRKTSSGGSGHKLRNKISGGSEGSLEGLPLDGWQAEVKQSEPLGSSKRS
jgi:hypothetical protein